MKLTQGKEPVPLPPMFDQKRKILNGVDLHTIKGIGFNQEIIKTMACYVNETKVAYCCGRNVIIYDLLTQTQKSYQRSKDEAALTTFNCFKTMYGQEFIIYATKAGKNVYPQVSVLNVWKSQTKTYKLFDLDVDSLITDVLLIGQGNRFVILSKEESSSRFIIFNLDQSTPYYNQSIDLQIKGIFSVDSYSDDIYFFSQTQIYNLRYAKQNSIEKIDVTLFPNQKIIDVKLANMAQYTFVIITDQGYLILKRSISGTEVRQDLGTYATTEPGKPEQIVQKRKIPSALCISESIIIVGYYLCQLLTVVKVHNSDFNRRNIEHIKFNCPYLHKIVSLSFSQQATSVCLVVQFKEQDRYGINMKVQSQFLLKKGQQPVPRNPNNHHLPPGRIIPVVFNLVLYQTLLQTFRSPFQSIMDNLIFHKPVLSVNLVPYKKIVLILSQDKKLRAMKFDITSISLSKLFLWQHEFNDQPTSMDVHPSNFSLVLAFRQGIRIYTIGSEGILPNFYWNVKGCDVVRFSSYGHILVVGTASVIYLLNPYSTQQISQFNVHIGPIKQISFLDHDNYIYLQSQNGAVNIYTISGSRRLQYTNKAIKSIASFYDSKNDILVVSSAEGTMKFYKDRGSIEFGMVWTMPLFITNILVVNQFKCIILATSEGTIRIHQWPVVDINHFQKNYHQKILHDGPITNMKMSFDMSYLISYSQTSIYITKLQHFSEGLVTTESQIVNLVRNHSRDYLLLYHLDRLVLCSNAAQNLRQQRILQFDADKADNQDMSAQNIIKQNDDYKKKLLDIEAQCNRLKQQKSEKFNNDINAVTLCRKKKQQQGKARYLQHKTNIVESQSNTNNQMLNLYAQHDNLLLQIENLRSQQNKQMSNQKQTYYLQQKSQTDEYNKKISKLQTNVNKIRFSYELSIKSNDEMISQKDEQNQILKQQERAKLDIELAQDQQRGIDLRKKNNRLLAQILRYNFRNKQLAAVMSEIEGQIEELFVEKREHEDSLNNIAKVLSQQDNMINHSEKKAKQYLKKNIVQTNKQQYLSHRTQQLQSRNNQLEIYLTQIDDKQKDMYQQFVKQSMNKKQASLKWTDSIQTAQKLKQILANLNNEKYQVKYSIQQMTTKIVHLLKDHPDGLQVQYQKLFQSQKVRQTPLQIGVTNQQIDYNSLKVSNLIANAQKKKKLNQTNDAVRKNILTRANHQAIALTSECNELRYQQVKLQDMLKILKLKLQDLKNSCDQRPRLSDMNLNVSAIGQKGKSNKLPFELLQDETRMKRMYQLLAKDDLTQANLQNKLTLLKQLKKMQVNKSTSKPIINPKAKAHKFNKSLTNESSIIQGTKLNSQGNSLTLPSIKKTHHEFSMILNSSMDNKQIDTTNILGKVLSDDDK